MEDEHRLTGNSKMLVIKDGFLAKASHNLITRTPTVQAHYATAALYWMSYNIQSCEKNNHPKSDKKLSKIGFSQPVYQ